MLRGLSSILSWGFRTLNREHGKEKKDKAKSKAKMNGLGARTSSLAFFFLARGNFRLFMAGHKNRPFDIIEKYIEELTATPPMNNAGLKC